MSSPAVVPVAPEGAATTPPPKRRRRLARWLAALGALLVAYGLAGFLLAPRLLRSAIVERGAAALHRRVTVGEVKVNPFTLAVRIHDLVVDDLDAPRLLGWELLSIRLAPWKVLRGDVGVAEIRLTRPFARVALDATGRLNVQDLLETGSGGAEPAATPRRSKLGIALDRLEIEEAQVVFEDGTRASLFRTILGPVTIRLSDFRTRGGADSPYAFSGTTELGETFSWSGTLLSEPLRSSGTISFSGLRLTKYDPYLEEAAPPLLIESGALSIETGYHFEWGAAGRRLSLSGLKVVVEDVALARRRDRSRALELPRVELSGGEVDVLGQVASIAELKVLDARLMPQRDADGRMAILEMLERPAPSTPAARAEARPGARTGPTPGTTAGAAPGWRWSIQSLALERGRVEAQDHVPPRPVRLSLSAVSLKLTGLAGRPDVACPLTASFQWGDRGAVSVSGKVWPFAPRAELDLRASGLELAPLGPYLDGAAPLRLAAAQLGLAARATFDGRGTAPAWTFAGDVRLDGLSMRHPSRDEELVRWRSLELLGVDAASASARASVRTIRVTEPQLRAVVFEDGTTSFGGGKGTGGAAAPAPAAARTEARTGPAWRTSIGLFQIVKGRVTVADRSMTPPVLVALTGVEARVSGLSSDARMRSRVDVRAQVEGEAPLTVTGTVNPLQALAYTDLAVAAKGIDLTPLDPYAGKHLGYGLQKGKLDLDLAYKVEDRAIRAGNVIRIDQLTLGEATHSPDATSLPVRLALALLTDPQGVILLDVPVEGRTDDPEFRLGRVIWRAVLNVLVKVATSPFSALAALAGGGDTDISLVEFAPGSARLDEGALRRVQLLARSLAQRPRLALDLEATVDSAADLRALRRAELELKLRRAKTARANPPPDDDALAAMALSPDERKRLVEELYAASYPPPGGAAKGAPAAAAAPPTPAEQEARLVEAVALPPEALQTLEAARHAAAREALVGAGLDPARLFAVQGGPRATKESGARVYFTVR